MGAGIIPVAKGKSYEPERLWKGHRERPLGPYNLRHIISQ